MKASEIREMNPDELTGELEAMERRLFEIRTQAVTEKLEDPSRLTRLKRDIARIKTVMRERELARRKSAETA
ncbi:MAG: 50S ribosomal protein L29 [Sedimentisphaerales bacterium]|nr:50S ribosomal protein L29 [Sedimentisphaerales bacterium]